MSLVHRLQEEEYLRELSAAREERRREHSPGVFWERDTELSDQDTTEEKHA